MKLPITFSLLLLALTASAQWESIPNFMNEGNSLFATNDMTCHVAGDNGFIHRTTDGGETWNSFDTGFEFSWMFDIQLLNESVGYACGGTFFGNFRNVIVKTTDGGVTWDSLHVNGFPSNYKFEDLHFVNENTGFFLGDYLDQMIVTTDGGQTFSTTDLPAGDLYESAIHFIDEQTGFVTRKISINSDEAIYTINKTENQGATWTVVYQVTAQNAFPNGRNINAIYFRDATEGYAVGENGWFYATTDGGDSWSESKVIADSMMCSDVVFTDSNNGYIAANKAPDNSFIYETIDAGQTWTQVLSTQQFSSTELIGAISMLETGVGYFITHSSIFKQSNPILDAVSDVMMEQANLFPNPTNDKITLSFPSPKSGLNISLVNALGQSLATYELNGTDLVCSVSGIPTGVYWLRWLDANDELVVRAFVKE